MDKILLLFCIIKHEHKLRLLYSWCVGIKK